uniref:cell division protein n=1 Tax=Gayralia brasiliensis TaxID=1286870 RepID=UPI002411726C|nr:cell division protein [Gayralia brasiliensis]YP_010733783.1 cell division protein [Monostroma nitidum]WEG92980.1 cell division protein [Gayralia brasiliensis]WEG93054.1 cell division protein [Monostroma nitidum]
MENFKNQNKIMENFKNQNKKKLKSPLSKPFATQTKKKVLPFSVRSFKTRGQAPSFSWKKSIFTVYYLVIAYQKTLRVKLNDYFKKSTKTRFFFAISPFIAYFIQISLEKSEWKYQQNTFLQKSLPKLSKPIQEISWETFAYTKYSNQIKDPFINTVYQVDNCFFISLNPVWQLKQKQFFTGTFESFNEKNVKWSFLPSRYFYQLLPETQKTKFKETFFHKASVFNDPFQKDQAQLRREIKTYSRWQLYFNELDDIPTKLNSVFQYEKPFLKQQKETINSPVVLFCKQPLSNKVADKVADQVADSGGPAKGFFASEKTFGAVSTLNQEMLDKGDSTDFINQKSDTVLIATKIKNQKGAESKMEQKKEQEKTKKDFTEFKERFVFLSGHYQESINNFKEKIEKQKNFWQQNGFSTIRLCIDDEMDFQTCEPACFTENLFSLALSSQNPARKKSACMAQKNVSATAFSKSMREIRFQRKKMSLNSIWLIKKDFSVLKKKNLIGLLSEKSDFVGDFAGNQTALTSQKSSLNLDKIQSQKVFSQTLSRQTPVQSACVAQKISSQVKKNGSTTWPVSKSDLTWIDFLIDKFNKNLSQEQRNFQYNINLGFSQFGKIVKLTGVLKPRKIEKLSEKTLKTPSQNKVLNLSSFVDNYQTAVGFLRGETGATKASENQNAQKKSKRLVFDFVEKQNTLNSTESLEISSIWQNEIRNHLTSAQPIWIKELINQNPTIKEKQVGTSLIQMSDFDFLSKRLRRKFKFDKSTTNVLNKKPDLILSFFKKSTKLKNKQTLSLTVNPLMKRKLSGYLYPDSLRETLLKNFSEFKIGTALKMPFFPLQNIMGKKSGTVEKSELINVQKGFLSLVSPNEKSWSESIIEIYKPLIENSSLSKKKANLAYDLFFENQVKSSLTFSKLQNVFDSQKKVSATNQVADAVADQGGPAKGFFASEKSLSPDAFFNWIDPDKSFTAKKKDFFGSPIKSPIYGFTLEDYKNKYVTGQKKIEKNNLISPYADSQNFLIESLSKAKSQLHDDPESFFENQHFFDSQKKVSATNQVADTVADSGGPAKGFFASEKSSPSSTSRVDFLLKDAWNPNLVGLTGQTEKQKSFIELTKAPTYSTVFLEPISPWFLPLKDPLALIKQNLKTFFASFEQANPYSKRLRRSKVSPSTFQFANEKGFGFSQKALSYKANLDSTKSKSYFQTEKNTLLGVEKQLADEGAWEKTFKQKTFSATLYEPISLKSWSILSQLGFAFIVLKVADIFKKEYQEEVGYYMNDFFFMLKDYPEFSFLFPSKENFRVIKNKNKKFSDFVGARFVLTELGEILLILRNSRKVFSKLEIAPPSPLIVSNSFYKSSHLFSLPNNVVFQQPNRFSTKRFFSVGKPLFTNNLKNDLIEIDKMSEKGFAGSGTKSLSKPLNSTQTPFLPNLKFEKFIPKGVLLVGPPGTGKTLLVQALAGEATVPILIESGKTFTTDTKTQGSEQLKDLFKAARDISPCVLFLDEVDTIGQKRENVLSTAFAATGEKQNKIPNPLNRISFQNLLTNKKNSSAQITCLSNDLINESFSEFNWDVLNPLMRLQITKNVNIKQTKETNHFQSQLENKINESSERQKQDLELLTQLLCELDGLNKTQDIIVIGATNRPATLDTALTRPGRFGKVLYLDLPGKQKRLSLLKFYSRSRNKTDFLLKKSTGLALEKQEPFWQQSWAFFSLRSKAGKKLALWPAFRSKLSNVLSPLKTSQKLWRAEPKSIGVAKNVNWNDFANQTVGLSAAHLSAAMNRSTFKAIFISFSKNKTFPVNNSKNHSNTKNLFLEDSSWLTKPRFFQTRQTSWFLAFKKLFIHDSKKVGIENQIQQSFFSLRSKPLNQDDLLGTKLSTQLLFESMRKLSSQTFSKAFFTTQVVKKGAYVVKKNGSAITSAHNDRRSAMLQVKKNESATFSLSKNFKLKWLAQSAQANNDFLNGLTFKNKDFSNQHFNSVQNQPLHTFETIEYGIKTISTITQSVEINFTKGKHVNKKIMGQLVLDDFVFPSKELFLTTKNVSHIFEKPLNRLEVQRGLDFKQDTAFFLKKAFQQLFSQAFSRSALIGADVVKKKGSSKRHFFYQRHFQYLRTLALLNGKSKRESQISQIHAQLSQTISSPIDSQTTRSPSLAQPVELQKKSPDFQNVFYSQKNVSATNQVGDAVADSGGPGKGFFAREKSSSKSQKFVFFVLLNLKILSKYVNRIIKNYSFGWVLLFNSTCLIENALFKTSIQKTQQKKIACLYYDLIFLNSEIKKNHSKTLLKWQTFNWINQTSLFSDSLFINRSAYYLSGKALLNFSTQIDPVDPPMSLWCFTHSMKSRQTNPFQKSKAACVAKIEFENVLLSLIAGKAAETLMLSNQLNPQKKQQSNIGIHELKQLGFVIKLMAEKDFFFSQKQLTRNQINIELFENKKQINQQKELLFLKELTTLFENQKQTSTESPINPLKLYDEFKSGDQPWWQFQSIDLLCSLDLKYSDWYRFLTSDEQENIRNIEWVAPDSFFHNILNNANLVSTKTQLNHLRLEKNNSFMNPKLVLKYSEFSKLNWNQIQLLESDLVASYYLFELFNKVFILLENNRELLDSLVYSLICYESLRDFEMRNSHRRYFKNKPIY